MSHDHIAEPIISRSGCQFQIRPVEPADETALAEFFHHVSADDLRFRFLTGLKEIGTDRLDALTHVDHRTTENFLAFVDDGSMIIASAMLACDPSMKRGEVAISVRSDFKRDGVGWEMLAHVAKYAESKGVETIESIESRDNHEAIELERDMGFTATAYPGDATLILLQRSLVPVAG
jgi:GNAT superfamily N-acetyltransferase